jgi:anti-anti-sigma factor
VSASDRGAARLRIETLGDASAARIVLRGEVDAADVDQLKTALDNIQMDGARTVELDVSDLGFVDVAALRALTAFAHQVKRTGRTVVTRGAGPTLSRIAQVLGVNNDLGLPRNGPV